MIFFFPRDDQFGGGKRSKFADFQRVMAGVLTLKCLSKKLNHLFLFVKAGKQNPKIITLLINLYTHLLLIIQ